MQLEDNGGGINYQPLGLNKKKLMIAFTQKDKNDCNKMTFLWLDINRRDDYIYSTLRVGVSMCF
jgi:3-methyladenine DNA glycosylase Mpg